MKRFISYFLILLLLISVVPTNIFAEIISEPYLLIENSDIPILTPGRQNTINLKIKNLGNSTAENVVMTPTFEDKSVFTLDNLTNSTNLPNISSNGTIDAKLKLNIAEDAPLGNYPVNIKLAYRYTEVIINQNEDGTFGKPMITQKSATQDLVIYVRVNTSNSSPKLLVNSVKTTPEVVYPGQKFKLDIDFENKGSLAARNVSIKLDKLNNEDGLYLASGSDTIYKNIVYGDDSSSAVFYLRASDKVAKGSQELNVTFSYNGKEETQKIYIMTGEVSHKDSNLLIENIVAPNGEFKANENFKFTFDLRNNSSETASNITVKAESIDPAIVPKSASIKQINTLKSGEKTSLEFIFSPTKESISRNYLINLSIEYEDGSSKSGEKRQVNQYIGMSVRNEPKGDQPDTPPKGQAKLIIDKYSFNPQLVKAGENFEMTLSFFNTSKNKTVKNIKIFLTSEAGSSTEGNSSSAFTPVDSSNTFYIDSIKPKGRIEKKITMFTIPDAIAKTHTITANFEYEDSDDKEYTGITELIGVPVVQQSRLDTGELTFMPEAYVGEPAPISVEFYNTGRVNLYNMMVKLEGDFQTENGQYFVGNFPSGQSEFFEGSVIPSELGELRGELVFTYEDSTGATQELRKDFALNVMDSPYGEEEFPEGPPIEEGNGGIRGILKSKLLWGTLLLAAIITGVVIYRRKKKEKELSLDE